MKKILALAVLCLMLTTVVNAKTNRYSTLATKKVVKTEYQKTIEKRNKAARRRYANFKPVSNAQVQRNLAKAGARILKNTSLSKSSKGYQAQMAMRKR